MKQLSILFFLLITVFLSADPIDVDILVNKQTANTKYSANKLLRAYVDEAKWECISIHFIDSKEQGTSPYILELWEEEEFLRNYVFKEKKSKMEKNKKGVEVEKKYTIAGVRVRTKIQYYGRLSERETDVVLEIFKVNGDIDQDIDDEDVKAKMKPKWIDNRELNEAMLERHANKILELREKTGDELKSLLGFALQSCINKRLLGPVQLTDIVEKDKDKVKKMNFQQCAETPLKGDGALNLTCYSEEEMNGVKYIINQGGVYLAEKDNKPVFNVRGGKKEILREFQDGKPIYVGYKDYMFNEDLSSTKSADAKFVSFNFLYAALLPYTDLDKIKFELYFQSRYLGNRNLKVLATDFIKENGKNVDVKEDGVPELIYVTIGEMKKGLYDKKTGPHKSAIVEIGAYDDNSKKVEQKTRINGYKDSKENWVTNYDDFKMEKIDKIILKNEVEIIGIVEQNKGEVKKVLIRTMLPIEKNKIKVYDKKRVTKKTKELAKLKIKKVTGRYTAIAEVSDGKKELLPKLESGVPLTLVIEGPGFFSLASKDGFRNLGGMRHYTQ